MNDAPAVRKRSASGVRRGGDHFQDLFVWAAALELLRPSTRYTELGVELDGAGNVDDVVLRTHGEPGGLYGQVKWTTKTAELVTEDFLFAVKGKGRSILQKLYASWQQLRGPDTQPRLRLISNRALDRTDPLLKHVDGDTDRLTPYARTTAPHSDAGKALQRWALHIGVEQADLLDMLDNLDFLTGRTKTAELDRVRALMLAAGLDDSDAALARALGVVQEWIIAGVRTRTTDNIRQMVEELNLQRTDPSVILCVQAIDHHPHAIDADYTLDWVHQYAGDSVRSRTVPREAEAWKVMASDLAATVGLIEDDGTRSVMVRGAMRQATLFKVGTALPQTRNFELVYQQRQQVWSTTDSKRNMEIDDRTLDMQLGDGLAVAIGINFDPTDEIARHIADATVPVHSILVITPSAGCHDNAIATGGHCVALAEQIRNKVRTAIIQHSDTSHIHLFLAGPGGLALLLGHRWNRLRPTTVYEHIGIGMGYQPAFTIDA